MGREMRTGTGGSGRFAVRSHVESPIISISSLGQKLFSLVRHWAWLARGALGGRSAEEVTSRISRGLVPDIELDTENVRVTYERRGHRVRAVLIADVQS